MTIHGVGGNGAVEPVEFRDRNDQRLRSRPSLMISCHDRHIASKLAGAAAQP